MIVADTNIVSTFARIGRLDLLFAVTETDALHLPPAVIKEIKAGLHKGLDFLQPLVDGLTGGAGFYALELTAVEKTLADTLPGSLNAGERECIAGCAQRPDSKLLTNDKRAMRYCREHGITVIDLPVLLRWLWTRNIVSQIEVKALLDKMKMVENLQLSPNALATVFAPR